MKKLTTIVVPEITNEIYLSKHNPEFRYRVYVTGDKEKVMDILLNEKSDFTSISFDENDVMVIKSRYTYDLNDEFNGSKIKDLL